MLSPKQNPGLSDTFKTQIGLMCMSNSIHVLSLLQTDPTLLDVICCLRLHTLLHVVGTCCAKFETGQTFSYANKVGSCCVHLHVGFINPLTSDDNKLHSMINRILGLYSSSAQWPVMSNFCSWATRKSQFLHRNHMLGNLIFTDSEH